MKTAEIFSLALVPSEAAQVYRTGAGVTRVRREG